MKLILAFFSLLLAVSLTGVEGKEHFILVKKILIHIFASIDKKVQTFTQKAVKFLDRPLIPVEVSSEYEDAETKAIKDEMLANIKKLKKYTGQDLNEAQLRTIFKEMKACLNDMKELSKKWNSPMISQWETRMEGHIVYTNITGVSPFVLDTELFLHEMKKMEESGKSQEEDQAKRSRINDLKDDIQLIADTLERLHDGADTSEAKSATKNAIRKFKQLANETNRDGLLDSIIFKQLKHRASQSKLDVASIEYDIKSLLKRYNANPPTDSLLLPVKYFLSLAQGILLLTSVVDKFDKHWEERFSKQYEILTQNFVVLIKVGFSRMFRRAPDKDRMRQLEEGIKSPADVKKAIEGIAYYLSKINEYQNQLVYRNLNKEEDEDEKTQQKHEKNGRMAQVQLHEIELKLRTYLDAEKLKKGSSEVINDDLKEASKLMNKLKHKLHINALGVYAQRLQRLTETKNDVEKATNAIGIIREASRNKGNLKIGLKKPIDYYVLQIMRYREVIPVAILLTDKISRNSNSELFSSMTKPLIAYVWLLADQQTVNGYDRFENDLQNIRDSLRHSTDPSQTRKGFLAVKKAIDQLLSDNPELM